MKKFFTSMACFALVLFMGVAVGCSTTANVTYTILSGAETTSNNWYIENSGTNKRTIVAKNEEGNAEIATGIKIKLRATNSKEDSYTVNLETAATEVTGITTEAADMEAREVVFTVTTSANVAEIKIVISQKAAAEGETNAVELKPTTITLSVKLFVAEAE